MNFPVAIIDLGTNTFHLLISAAGKVLLEERRPVRIGVGGINRDLITDEAEGRALDCLLEYARLSRYHGASKIFATGTSAFRNARNGAEVAARLERATNIPIHIISGEEEARLIWEGIRSGMNLGSGQSLIIDIGGGSVEFIIANQQEITWKQSLEIGGQRLIEKFNPADPITTAQVIQVSEYLKERLSVIAGPLAVHRPDVLIGSSGSFDTISEIHCRRIGLEYIHGPETPIDFSALATISDELISKNREQRMVIPGMIPLRVDMIVVACILIREVVSMHPFQSVRISGYSLKEGVLATLA